MFLACAKEGEVQYIVSEDNDLLVLNSYEGIKIINVLDFVTLLQSADDPDDSNQDVE